MFTQSDRFILSCDGHRIPMATSSLLVGCGFKCQICDVCFSSSQDLRDHYATSFELEPQVIEYMTQMMCPGVDYNPKSEFLQEKPDVALILRKANPEMPLMHKCSECNLVYKSYKGLKQHIGKLHAKEDKQVSCQQCSKSYKNKYALKFHINQVHDKKTRAPCPICGKAIYNKYMIKAHIKFAHPDCELCNQL